MVNLCSGKKLWQPPALIWDLLEWDIVYSPHPEGTWTWYRVPGIPPMGSLGFHNELDPSPNEV
jgi:hypothetical protein